MLTLRSLLSSSLLLSLGLGGIACKRDGATATPPAAAIGTERGDCRPDRSCDHGLTCLSDLCVRPPPADCAKVGQAIGFIFLDNYTPREERSSFLAEIARQCAAANLSREDGECLAAAKTRLELRSCPHPIGLGDCKKIAAHADAVRARDGVDAYLVTAADRLIERCKSEVPSLAFERCALAASTMSDLERCAW